MKLPKCEEIMRVCGHKLTLAVLRKIFKKQKLVIFVFFW